ncbi:MAG: winged helix-turn-helix domain-containing protein [Gammaproteobacteria bacterium]|nr:winged helix-turn-helix domain-containing protein [Gammaproteobacteria bacterium]
MMGDWTFFSNHGHVLVCLARDNDIRLRDVAAEVGITERAVQKIVRDLQDAGFLTVSKQGRCNRYQINRRRSLRHSIESHCTVGKLLALVARSPRSAPQSPTAESPAAEPPAAPAATEAAPAVPESEPKKKLPSSSGKPKKEDASESKPVDVRQQGSLF